MRPKWAKAHGRRAQALEAAGNLLEASAAYGTAEKLAVSRSEAADYAAARRIVDGSSIGNTRVVQPPSARVHAAAQQEESDDDIGEPLGEPVVFEPVRARVCAGGSPLA